MNTLRPWGHFRGQHRDSFDRTESSGTPSSLREDGVPELS
eukprot:gene26768-biopygen17320